MIAEPRETGTSRGWILGLAITIMLAAAAYHLASAARGESHYRDQHLGPALIYATNGIDLLRPVIIGFNATGTPTPQELPLWQAMAGVAFKYFGPWFGWANLVSLLVMASSLFPLYGLAAQFFGPRCACWTLVFFAAQPLIFLYAGIACTDGFSLVVTIWFLFFAMRMLASESPAWWLGAVAGGCLSALSKLPFFMAAGLACFFWLLLNRRRSVRAWLLLGSIGAISAAVFFAWTHYTDGCIAGSEYPAQELRASSAEMKAWYFGTWSYRLNPFNYFRGGWRVLKLCFGSFAFTGLFLYALIFIRGQFPKLLLLGGVLTTLVFTHLVLHHHQYYLMFAPAVALLCAQTVLACETGLELTTPAKARAFFGLVAVMIALSLIQGLVELRAFVNFEVYPRAIANIMARNSLESDKLLVVGGEWGGNELLLANRRGLSVVSTRIIDSPTDLSRLKQLGYKKLVILSESPLVWAVEKINPGMIGLERQSYTNFVIPASKDWPVVFQNEDILIKQIP